MSALVGVDELETESKCCHKSCRRRNRTEWRHHLLSGTCHCGNRQRFCHVQEHDNSVVKILEGGSFTGEINAPRVEIAGRVDANVTGTTSVSIDSSAEVSGVIRFFKLAVSPGAVITGELVTMAEESESPLAQVTK